MDARRERKVVTVLFADLVGFTSRSEALDPEDVDAILSRYHGRLRAELERFGGTVEKFIGDAVMALFGAPVAHEDDPERAVRAALAIRDAFAEEGELELRIAVNTGEALVTVGARPAEGEGMAAGDVVNTTARLQAAAPANGILVGETTYRATRDVIEYREAPPVEAKGKAEPVAVWEALEARSRVEVELRRPHTPLVGRQREVDVLADALARTRVERSPQLVTLVGAPGLGKSRLVYELFRVVENDPEFIYWRQGRSLPYGDGVAFWALGEMVKAHAGILETDDAATVEAKVTAAVSSFEQSDWLAAHLRPLVGLGSESSADAARDEAFTAWRRFFEELGEELPLVLVFEDLHWADDGLLDFVDHLVDWSAAVPMLVVCSARPELLARRPGWGGGKRNAITISVGPLTSEDTARLVAALMDRAVLPADTQAMLLARADGNPLYAEEYVRLLAEGRTPEELPETVQGIIAARLDALPPEEKALVQDAAVIGRVFWLGALGGGAEAERRLHELERKEFVRRERRSIVEGDGEYAFVHALVREVAYAQIPRSERGRKHETVARWIESLGRSEDTAEMVAHHYRAALEYMRAAGADVGELADRARFALRDAGDRSAALHAYEAAARFYAEALELWPADDPERARLLLERGRALSTTDAGGVDLFDQAIELFLAAGQVEHAAAASAYLSNALWNRGARDEAHARSDQAIALLSGRPVSEAKAWALASRARFHMLADNYDEAIGRGEEALAIARALGLREAEAQALITIGTARSRSDTAEGIRLMQQGLDVALEVGEPAAIQRGYNNLAQEHVFVGRLDEAVEALRAAEASSSRYGHVMAVRWVRGELATIAYSRGDWAEAERLANEFLAEVEAGRPHYHEVVCRAIRAHVALARGDLDTATAQIERSLVLAHEIKDHQSLLPALAGQAWILLEAGRSDGAREVAQALADAIRGAGGFSEPALMELPETMWTLHSFGLAGDLAESLAARPPERARPWVTAALAIARDAPAEAARVLGAMGARTDEAYARLRAAEGGDLRQLEPALAFYRSVGATAFVRRAEALLPASA